jgi:small-conductance mechanosensitive channel
MVVAQLIARTDLFGEAWFRTNGVVILIVIVTAIVVSRIGTLAVRRYRRRLEGSAHETGPLQARRAATIAGTLVTTIRIAVWSVALLIVLGELGVNIGPLLASAGIAGVALSFGAQSIVRDFLTGFFVLVEDQYAVGDVVELTIGGGQPLSGRVETLTLRATAVRAPDGTLAMAGNGSIVAVKNRSRGEGELRVEIEIPDVGDLTAARRRLEASVAELRADEALQAILSSGPVAVDLVPTAGGGGVAIVTAETRASRKKRAEEALRRGLAVRLLAPADPRAGEPKDQG